MLPRSLHQRPHYLLALLILVGTLVLFAGCTRAFAYPRSVTRWKPYIVSASKRYHLSAANRRWAIARGLHIIYGESRGHTHTGHRNGCFGLWQFGAGWSHHGGYYPHHHHRDWRACGRCSTWRAVKVLKVGGRSAWRRHWRATIS